MRSLIGVNPPLLRRMRGELGAVAQGNKGVNSGHKGRSDSRRCLPVTPGSELAFSALL